MDQRSAREAVNLTGRRLMHEIERARAFDCGNNKVELQDQYTQLDILLCQHDENGTIDEV